MAFVISGKLVENEIFSFFMFIFFPMLKKYSLVCSTFN